MLLVVCLMRRGATVVKLNVLNALWFGIVKIMCRAKVDAIRCGMWLICFYIYFVAARGTDGGRVRGIADGERRFGVCACFRDAFG